MVMSKNLKKGTKLKFTHSKYLLNLLFKCKNVLLRWRAHETYIKIRKYHRLWIALENVWGVRGRYIQMHFCEWFFFILINMMTSSNGNIFRVTGPLCGEFTGPGEFPTQRPVTRSFDVFFDLHLNKRLSKQPWAWWFETPSWSFWRQCNVFQWSPSWGSNWH